MKNRFKILLYTLISLLLVVIGTSIMLLENVFFYDSNNNSAIAYLDYSTTTLPTETSNKIAGVYIPKKDLIYTIDSNKIIFKGFVTYKQELPSELSNGLIADINLFIIKFNDNSLNFISPSMLDLAAGNYEINDEDLKTYFDFYTNTQAIEKYRNSFWNDESGFKRQIISIGSNLMILAAIILIYIKFKNNYKVFLTLNVVGILAIILTTIIIINGYYINYIFTPFSIFCWVIYLISFVALNFKKIIGKDSEQIFP